MTILSAPEAALYLRLSVFTLATWRSKRRGPKFFKAGKAVRYSKEDLDRYIRTRKVETR